MRGVMIGHSVADDRSANDLSFSIIYCRMVHVLMTDGNGAYPCEAQVAMLPGVGASIMLSIPSWRDSCSSAKCSPAKLLWSRNGDHTDEDIWRRAQIRINAMTFSVLLMRVALSNLSVVT